MSEIQRWARLSERGKHFVLRLIAGPLSRFMRMHSFTGARRLVWYRLLKPYLMWRNIRIDATAAFGGKFHCRVGDLVQGRIFVFGVWEPNLTRFIQGRIRPGDTFIDVGANIGYFSVLASRLVGLEGKVVSIEASPSIFETLNEHLRLNKAHNVRAINAAAAAEPGTLSIYQGPENNLGATSTLASRGQSLEAKVIADRLSALVGDDLLRARLIKIDVEGAEPPILLDLLSIADSLSPDLEIVVEITPAELSQFGITVEEIFARFKAAGFNAYLLENFYFDDAYIERPSLQTPRRLTSVPLEQADIVFSRIDAAQL